MVASLVLLAAAGPGPAASAPIHVPAAPGAMDQLDRLPVIGTTAQVAGASSRARDGSNLDGSGFLDRDPQGRYVLMEAAGPGAITRLWATGALTGRPLGSLNTSFGRLQFFFDGETRPRIDLPASELFSGPSALAPAPLCGGPGVSSGGNFCDVRLPFARGVRVVSTAPPAYFDIGYETYPAGTAVRSHRPGDPVAGADRAAAARRWRRAGTDPRILPPGPVHRGRTRLAAGAAATLVRIRRAGTIRGVRIGLDRPDDAALRGVRLRARWDGAARPAVDVPLADLFLTGAGERAPARGLLAGYDPAAHTGYVWFPMPFARAAHLELVNRGARAVTARWRVEESAARYAGIGRTTGRFHATASHDAATAFGRDHVLLDARGRGKVVGLSFTEAGPHSVQAAYFLEGDERVSVDGARTPAISGTGTEDVFGGAYYYVGGPFTLPDHGATAKEAAGPDRARAAQYRLLLSDPWPFRDRLRFTIEHAGGNALTTAIDAAVFWYGTGRPGLRRTDAFDVVRGAGHRYRTTPGRPALALLTGFFDGDRDGNPSSIAGDDGFVGARPPAAGADPLGEAVTARVATHPAGTTITFDVAVDPGNDGVVLRRTLDQAVPGQRARVSVGGRPAGTWLTAGSNASKRWADSDIALPVALTAGRRRLSVTLRADTPWTDARYTALSVIAPDPQR